MKKLILITAMMTLVSMNSYATKKGGPTPPCADKSNLCTNATSQCKFDDAGNCGTCTWNVAHNSFACQQTGMQ